MRDRDHGSYLKLTLSAIALIGSLGLNYYAGGIADAAGELGAELGDPVLTWLPTVDTRFLFVWGFAAFVGWLIVVATFREEHRLGHIVWLYALLIAIRSLFIMLLPLKAPSGALPLDEYGVYVSVGRLFARRHDLFFSAHTALPFLAFLLFRRPYIRLSFFLLSAILGVAVLLGRMHYAIDVVGAYFITYAVYRAEPALRELGCRWEPWGKFLFRRVLSRGVAVQEPGDRRNSKSPL